MLNTTTSVGVEISSSSSSTIEPVNSELESNNYSQEQISQNLFFLTLKSRLVVSLFYHLGSLLTSFYLLFLKLNNPKFLKNLLLNTFFQLDSYCNYAISLLPSTSSISTFAIPIKLVFDLEFEIKILISLLFALSVTLLLIFFSWKFYSTVILNFKLNKGKMMELISFPLSDV